MVSWGQDSKNWQNHSLSRIFTTRKNMTHNYDKPG